MSKSEQAALAAAQSLLLGGSVEGEETPSSEAPVVVAEVEEVVVETPPEVTDLPSFDLSLPEDLEEELEVPDFHALAEEEEDLDDEELDDLDPQVAARLKAAEKEAAYYREQRKKSEQKNWVAEGSKFFPLAEPFLNDIQADSRRSFLRQAKQIHESIAPLVEEKVLKPAREAIEAEKEKARAEARAEAERAWGRPTLSDPAPVEAVERGEELNRPRRSRDFASTVKSMIFKEAE